MTGFKDIVKFIEFDIHKNYIIEPGARLDSVKERILDVLNIYKPGVIVKAGIGHGDILNEISLKSDAYIVVVEPSLKAIKDYLENNKQTNIKFINGDFHDFPVDYFAADLLICIDYLDFFDSSKAISEFGRALKLDGIFFIATVVLGEDDVDGIYDDLARMVFPLHNDYYLASDLKTFLELKDFSLVKSMHLKFNENLKSMIDYSGAIFEDLKKEGALKYIETQKNDLARLLGMDDDYTINQPYYIGVFMRLKPKTGE